MGVYTVFALGTGERLGKANTIITQFYKACKGDPLIINGPGVLGKEVVPNAQEATKQILDWLLNQPDVQNNINLTGFSRGSVTCIHIANGLKHYQTNLENKVQNNEELTEEEEILLPRLQQLNIHMFLSDPVAGMGDKGEKDGRVIPSNVKSYVAIIQKDEMRRDFEPQDMTRIIVASPETTKVTMLPMYGSHSDTIKIKKDGMESGPKIVWHSLYQFLTQHGTSFKGNTIPQVVTSQNTYVNLSPNPDPRDLLKQFSINHGERKNYLKSGQQIKFHDGIPTARVSRAMNKHVPFYVRHSSFFVNQLEQELFKVCYPKTFNYLFEQNQLDIRFPGNSASTKVDVIKELHNLQKEDPLLFKRLAPLGVQRDRASEEITVWKTGGYYSLEPCMTLQQMYPDFVPNLVTLHAPLMNKLPLLEREVYRLTFQYQRDKSWFQFAGARAEHDRAQTIRENIQDLVNWGNENKDAKYLRVLDTLEAHYKELVRVNNSSELTTMLRGLLAKHKHFYEIEPATPVREVLSDLVGWSLTLVNDSINLIGNLGYIGGFVFYRVGTYIEDIGRRINELLGEIGYNPLKYLAAAAAYCLEGGGFIIKNSLGLRPLTEFLTSAINYLKESLLNIIDNTEVNRIDVSNPLKEALARTAIPSQVKDEPLHKRQGTREDRNNEELNEPLVHKNKSSNATVRFKELMREQRKQEDGLEPSDSPNPQPS